MKVPNWSTYQGYKKRGPPWVKLHVALLRKREWLKLPLSGKALLPALWIIASESGVDGSLPNDPDVLSHLSGLTEAQVVEGLDSLISFGFIERDKTVAHHATKLSGETERETETKGEGEARVLAYREPPMPDPTPIPAWESNAKAVWSKHLGGENDYIYADLVPVVRRFGPAKTLLAWEAYCKAAKDNQGGKFASARSFAQKPGPWMERPAEGPRHRTIAELKALEGL